MATTDARALPAAPMAAVSASGLPPGAPDPLGTWTLVIHYNNPASMAGTVAHLAAVGFAKERIVVYDNGSKPKHCAAAEDRCAELGCGFMASTVNHGWGGAINDFLGSRTWAVDHVLLIAAHDTRVLAIDFSAIARAFEKPECLFVSPSSVFGMEVAYSAARSFWYRTASAEAVSSVRIGHATACLSRPAKLKEIGFDEEYFIYGCESEVFLRAADAGYITTMLRGFVVDNIATDSSSEFCTRAYAINSMYTAWKRRGLGGAVMRAGALAVSAARMRSKGQASASRIKLAAAVYGLVHPYSGFRSFLEEYQAPLTAISTLL